MIDLQMGKFRFCQSKKNTNELGVGVPFVMKDGPKCIGVVQLMKKLQRLLSQYEIVKKVFTAPLIVSYRSARKISCYLVRGKLYPSKRKVGYYKCGNLRCLNCDNIEETDTFSSTVTGKSFQITHHLHLWAKLM